MIIYFIPEGIPRENVRNPYSFLPKEYKGNREWENMISQSAFIDNSGKVRVKR